MKIKLEDKILVEEYIEALSTVEKVLWQEKMGSPPKYLENYTSSCFPRLLVAVLFLIFSYNIGGGYSFQVFILFFVPFFIFLNHFYMRGNEADLEFAREQTQYIVTNKRIIFILYRHGLIQIQSIPYENIKKVYSSKKLDTAANVYIVSVEQPPFQTFKYWSQKPHEKIVMVQVENYKRALDIIQEHLF